MVPEMLEGTHDDDDDDLTDEMFFIVCSLPPDVTAACELFLLISVWSSTKYLQITDIIGYVL